MIRFSVPARRAGAGLVALLATAAIGLTACGSSSSSTSTSTASDTTAAADLGSVSPVSADSCTNPEYGGDGQPEALIVSDLPMQGDSAERSSQQVDAIRLALDDAGWKAGDTPVAFQACDDSIAKTGLWDEATCKSNASAYAANKDVLGVIGTYNSGCAALEIPILGKASVAMVSPGNTAVCLTESSPICEDGQPDSLYPNGRNYARVIPNDAFQGAGLATFAKQQGVSKPFIAYAADDPTSTGQAENFRGAAESLGMKPSGFETWDPKAKSYSDLFGKAKKAGADGVVLAGLTEQNAAQVIKDKVAVLGDNASVPLIGFDGLAQQSTIDTGGAAAKDMYAGLPGLGADELPQTGKDFVSKLKPMLDGKPVEQFAPYAGQAADVLLDAIDGAGTDRAAVADALFGMKVSDGIVGSFTIEASGDPSSGPITVLKAGSTFEPQTSITPDKAEVAAARG